MIRIRDARDTEAWQRFVKLYAPPVYGFARKRGLQDSDAADLTQEVLRSVVTAVGRLDYDRRRGSFRGWLFTIVRRKLLDFFDRQARQSQGSGDTGIQVQLEDQTAPEQEEWALWNQQYEQQLMARALELARCQFQESSWQAFRQTALEGKKAKDVARSLSVSVAAVYMAKSRVMAKLKEHIRQLQQED